ncbi:hypothetical protein ABK905_11940 [Acerihabitans sp. KWT182]|uniref:Uncharacterized protein n=1 Tax=Acerihabitans sp. KWT182 TaxID=3157919 RepID=A0AAU7QEP3_9GAMM
MFNVNNSVNNIPLNINSEEANKPGTSANRENIASNLCETCNKPIYLPVKQEFDEFIDNNIDKINLVSRLMGPEVFKSKYEVFFRDDQQDGNTKLTHALNWLKAITNNKLVMILADNPGRR